MHELAVSDLMASASAHTTFDGHRLRQDANPAAYTRYEFLLPVASTIDPDKLRAYLDELNAEHLKYFGPEASTLRLTLVPDAAEALHHARASVVASGTATVLAALVGNPFVVVYKVSPLSYALLKRLVRYPDEFADMAAPNGDLPISMVNLIAQERVVPELLQERFNAARVASELAPLLAETPERQRQISGLQRVRELLARGATHGTNLGSSIERVAETVVSLLHRTSSG
jgi:lipid-A-disaccharide synthase